MIVFAAGALVGAVATAVSTGPDAVAPEVPATASGPVPTVYVPATMADTPSEADRVKFEEFCERFIRAWLQPGPVDKRRELLKDMMTPPALAKELARDQDGLPVGQLVGPPSIANASAIGGLYLTRLSTGRSVQLVISRGGPQGWQIDWIEGAT